MNPWIKRLDQKKGFPQDDALSIQQGSGTGNLDLFYKYQFIQNETQSNLGKETLSYFILEHTPILAGSLIGKVYVGTEARYIIEVSSSGEFKINKIGTTPNEVFLKMGNLKLNTGELILMWNTPPGQNSIVVSYEFDMYPIDQ